MSCFHFNPFTTRRKIRPPYAVLQSPRRLGPDHQLFPQLFWFCSLTDRRVLFSQVQPLQKRVTLKVTYKWWRPEVVPIKGKRQCLLPERWVRSDSPKPKPMFFNGQGKKISNLEIIWQAKACPHIISVSCWNAGRYAHQGLRHSLGRCTFAWLTV